MSEQNFPQWQVVVRQAQVAQQLLDEEAKRQRDKDAAERKARSDARDAEQLRRILDIFAIESEPVNGTWTEGEFEFALGLFDSHKESGKTHFILQVTIQGRGLTTHHLDSGWVKFEGMPEDQLIALRSHLADILDELVEDRERELENRIAAREREEQQRMSASVLDPQHAHIGSHDAYLTEPEYPPAPTLDEQMLELLRRFIRAELGEIAGY